MGGVNENLISSSKPLQLRRTKGSGEEEEEREERKEGVLDLINLFPYWIGSLPGADQLFPIMHLNDMNLNSDLSYLLSLLTRLLLKVCCGTCRPKTNLVFYIST